MQSFCTRLAAIAIPGLLLILAAPATAKSCQKETFEDSDYVVCSFDLAEADLRLYWRQPDGTPYATFPALASQLANEGLSLEFAMNGGMYGDDLTPIGLYIEDGKTLRPLNTATSDVKPAPNFYKKPNGVFYVGGGEAGVLTTEAFAARHPEVAFATQSGPMLVIGGKLHPAFIVGSNSLKKRNGVCAPNPTEVRFAITEGEVNFYDFGRFFRDHLGCDNALFLDGGSAPGLYSPELGRDDVPGHNGYGPIIAVVRHN